VEVRVVGRLSGGRTYIEADSEAVGINAVPEQRLGAVDQKPARPLLAFGEVEVGGDVSLWGDEGVTFRDGIWRREGDSLGRFGHKGRL
jgi:hypothetical protein